MGQMLVLQKGKAALNKDAQDVNGYPIQLKTNKVTSPVKKLLVHVVE